MRRVWLTAGTIAAFVSCTQSEPNVTIISPADVTSSAAWFELGAFEGATCSALNPMLEGGVPFSGAAARVAFRPEESSPAMGKLKFGSYAIGAVARAEDCTVLARGCIDADLGGDASVSVTLDPGRAGGACLPGNSCQAGQCVPVQDNSDPALASSCPLRLLGAGPLGIALRSGGELLSAPAIAPTERGFLVAYREVELGTGSARRVVVPIDLGGGVFQTLSIGLPGRCPASEEGDGAGLAHGSMGSLLAFARKPCGGLQGIDYIALDAAGNDVKYNFLGDPSIVPALSTARALTNRPGTDDFILGVVERGAALAVPIANGTRDPAAGSAARFACDPSSEAAVSASTQVVALASVGLNVAGDPDAGVPGSEGGVRVVLVKSTDPLNTQWCVGGTLPPTPARFPGSFVSVSTSDTKTIAVSNGTSGASYRVFEGTNTTPIATSDTVRVDGVGRVLFADVAIRPDRFFIAAEKLGAISLIAFTNSANPRREREFLLHTDPRVPPLTGVRDGRVAITATENRVAIAWTTARQLGLDEPVGGYAVFSCAP